MLKSLLLRILVVLLVLVASFDPAFAAKKSKSAKRTSNTVTDTKYASLVVDAETGEVIHQENAGAIRYPASLTKMMTIYLTFQALERGNMSMNKLLNVSNFAANQKPSVMGLNPGTSVSVNDVLNGVIIKSANDAAVVLAENLAGSEKQFAVKMNSVAKSLGMKNTRFTNASGLPSDQQVTTAYDLARLAIALRRDFPQYYPLFSRDSFTYKGRVFNSHNRVTMNYRGADGLKTGYIRASGFNLVTSAKRSGKSLVGVVMGGRSIKSRDENMMKLLDQAFYKMASDKRRSGNAADENEVSDSGSDINVQVGTVTNVPQIPAEEFKRKMMDSGNIKAASGKNAGTNEVAGFSRDVAVGKDESSEDESSEDGSSANMSKVAPDETYDGSEDVRASRAKVEINPVKADAIKRDIFAKNTIKPGGSAKAAVREARVARTKIQGKLVPLPLLKQNTKDEDVVKYSPRSTAEPSLNLGAEPAAGG